MSMVTTTYVINLHSYTQVRLLVFLKTFYMSDQCTEHAAYRISLLFIAFIVTRSEENSREQTKIYVLFIYIYIYMQLNTLSSYSVLRHYP